MKNKITFLILISLISLFFFLIKAELKISYAAVEGGGGGGGGKVTVTYCNGCACKSHTVDCAYDTDPECISSCEDAYDSCVAPCADEKDSCYSSCDSDKESCDESCYENNYNGDTSALNNCLYTCKGIKSQCYRTCDAGYNNCKSPCASAEASCKSKCTTVDCPTDECSSSEDCCSSPTNTTEPPVNTCTYIVCENGKNKTKTGTVPCPDDDPCPNTCTYIVCENGKNKTKTGTVPCPDNDPCPTKWSCDANTWTCSQSTSGYDTEDACKASCFPPCVINRFTLNGKTNPPKPLIFWVGQKVHGEFDTSYCDTCEVTSPNDVWSPRSSNSVWFTFKEPIQPTGTFTLNCSNSHNPDSETIVVQVRYLPRWREIIPNLGGFLKGLFR